MLFHQTLFFCTILWNSLDGIDVRYKLDGGASAFHDVGGIVNIFRVGLFSLSCL